MSEKAVQVEPKAPLRGGGTGLRGLTLSHPLVPLVVIVAFVLWAHFGSFVPVFRAHVPHEAGWEQFRVTYRVSDFGEDGYFVRATQNGYNVFYFTSKYAWRFTRKTGSSHMNACASCHTPADMAYSFVNSDRFDAKLGRRMSFEEKMMRCFVGPMEGFVPTLYDPVVRDLRIFARAIAHHLQLGEGALKAESQTFHR